MSKIPTLWLIIIGTILIAGSAYWFWVDDIKPFLTPGLPQIPELMERRAENRRLEAQTANWKIYRNEKYGFEVMYPNYLIEKKKYKEKIILGYRITREKYGDMTIGYGASNNLTPLDLAGPSEEVYKIIAWVGLNKDQYLKIRSAKSNLFHASYNATGHVDEVVIFSDKAGKMVSVVFEYHESNPLPIEQILSTFRFLE